MNAKKEYSLEDLRSVGPQAVLFMKMSLDMNDGNTQDFIRDWQEFFGDSEKFYSSFKTWFTHPMSHRVLKHFLPGLKKDNLTKMLDKLRGLRQERLYGFKVTDHDNVVREIIRAKMKVNGPNT